MADVTPRFMYDNLVPACPSIISAHTLNATANTGYPTSFLRDQLISKVWQSPTGWNVCTGYNDTFILVEATNLTATLTTGNYPTGALYAAMLGPRLTAASTGGNTYSVTYDGSTHKFTFTRTGGATNFTINKSLVTPANAEAGMTSLVRTPAAVAVVSDVAVYHGSEILLFDMGSVVTPTAFGIAGHNIVQNGSTSIVLQGNDTAALSSVNPLVSLQLGSTAYTVTATSSGLGSHRYWLVTIMDPYGADGYSKLGNVFIGSYLQPASAYAYSFPVARKEYSTVQYADQGANYTDIKAGQRQWTLDFNNISYADYQSFDTLRSAVRVGKNFWLAFDPQNDQSNCAYGFLSDPLVLQNVPAYPATLWHATLTFTEALG